VWLSIKKYKEPTLCIDNLKKKGYQMWVTDLSPGAIPLNKIMLQKATKIGIDTEYEYVQRKKKKVFVHGALHNKAKNLVDGPRCPPVGL
jgi:hypothetical protein